MNNLRVETAPQVAQRLAGGRASDAADEQGALFDALLLAEGERKPADAGEDKDKTPAMDLPDVPPPPAPATQQSGGPPIESLLAMLVEKRPAENALPQPAERAERMMSAGALPEMRAAKAEALPDDAKHGKADMPTRGSFDELTDVPAAGKKAFPQADGMAHRERSSSKGDDADDTALRSVKIERVDSTKHLALVQADPVRQIAAGVARALAAGDVARTPDVSDQQQPASPVKTLELKLEPEDLGSVTLRLRLTGNMLSVRLDVAEASTLHMIQGEQDRLHKSLTRDDCRVESIEIRAAPVASADSAPVQRSEESARHGSGLSARDENSSSSSAMQGGQQRSRGEGMRDSQSGKTKRDEDDSHGRTRRPASGLYL